MNHSTKRRRRRQPSTAASSAWFLSLLPLAQAQHQQAQHASSSASPSTYLRKSRQRQLQSASTVSYLTFSPTDDATIYSSTTDYDTLHQLIFTAGKSSSPELNALLKFDLDFINHKSSSELSKAQLHLCNSFDAGGAFDPHGADIYGVLPSYFSGGGDWSETAVTWQHSPQVDVSGGKAEFVESHKDDECFWHTFSVTNLVQIGRAHV